MRAHEIGIRRDSGDVLVRVRQDGGGGAVGDPLLRWMCHSESESCCDGTCFARVTKAGGHWAPPAV
jgi:hypothetical protein